MNIKLIRNQQHLTNACMSWGTSQYEVFHLAAFKDSSYYLQFMYINDKRTLPLCYTQVLETHMTLFYGIMIVSSTFTFLETAFANSGISGS